MGGLDVKDMENKLKAKYEKIMNSEVSSQRTAGNLANSTLLLTNLKKLRSTGKVLETTGATDGFQEFCYRYVIPLTGKQVFRLKKLFILTKITLS